MKPPVRPWGSASTSCPPTAPDSTATSSGPITHQEESYDLTEIPDSLVEHNALLRDWEELYNNLRPHKALGYLTPNEYVARWQAEHP